MTELILFQLGAGTIIREIISSFSETSVGGGGQTKLSIISSVVFMSEERSGGSVRDDLKNNKDESTLVNNWTKTILPHHQTECEFFL